jgi:hypothetical protein
MVNLPDFASKNLVGKWRSGLLSMRYIVLYNLVISVVALLLDVAHNHMEIAEKAILKLSLGLQHTMHWTDMHMLWTFIERNFK